MIQRKGGGPPFFSAFPAGENSGPGEARPRIEILLVEDNPADVRMMREALWLAEIPHNLSVVTDGEEALMFLHRKGKFSEEPRPDIVLLDIKLPKISGHAVLAAIRLDPDLCSIPVMMLTSSSAQRDRELSEDLQATHFVTKPLGLRVLAGELKIIEGLVKRSRS